MANEDQPELLRIGDLVLLKTQLVEDEIYAECGQIPGDTGYVYTDGLTRELKIAQVESLHSSGLDVRESVFVVMDQENYIAQKDLRRYKKQMAKQGSIPQPAKLKQYEERAQVEEEQNQERMRDNTRTINYGEMVQLQHLRTKLYLRINAGKTAVLDRTCRRVDIALGSTNSWLRLNPFYKHKAQGNPVTVNEQVSLESVKLGNCWNLSWSRCRNACKDEVLEINCARGGRGFYLELYSRSTSHKLKILSCPSPLRLWSPHSCGFVAASCSKSKPLVFMRRNPLSNKAYSAKDVWVIEPGLPDRGDVGIEWDETPILLRHFGSGRYMAIGIDHLEEVHEGLLEEPENPPSRSPPQVSRKSIRKLQADAPSTIQAELVEEVSIACWFKLEPADSMYRHQNLAVIPRGGCALLRWDSPNLEKSFWLCCDGQEKGKGNSLMMCWSSIRHVRDTIRMDILDDAIDKMDDSVWLSECEVVAEHRKFLRKVITPRCKDFRDDSMAAWTCSQCDHALTDMILFLSGSPKWRSNDVSKFSDPDPLKEPWTTDTQRQQLVLELKYIDATFDLFHALVDQTEALMEGDTKWARRAISLNVSMNAKLGKDAQSMKWKRVMQNMIGCLKTRCLKLLVRLWSCCFLNNHKVEMYFFKMGWVDTINSLNGHGLGSSDVFVALLSKNKDLAAKVDEKTIFKFIDFIRVLGPLDVCLTFMNAVCAPAESALGAMQQTVLENLVYAGPRASADRAATTRQNRNDLLISLKIMDNRMLGIPLGSSLGSKPPPMDQCMGRMLLVDGLMDIAIAWKHPPHWAVGKGVLYHGPQVLGINPIRGNHSKYQSDQGDSDDEGDPLVWVSLVEVVWALSPESCCEQATGTKWEDFQYSNRDYVQNDIFSTETAAQKANSGSRFDRLKTLAKFFLAQLQLISDLVKERQMNCILSLQEEYSFDLCVCGMSDHRLPASIRAAFCDILTDLWIDRHPHHQIVVPALMRFIGQEPTSLTELPVFSLGKPEPPETWSTKHADALPLEVHSFYKHTTTFKMEPVLRSLRHELSAGPVVEQQVHSAVEDNVLLSALLRCFAKLMRFGFIHSVDQVHDIMGPVVRCLDGRTDLMRPLAEVEVLNSAEMRVDVLEPFTPLLANPDDQKNSKSNYFLPRSRFPPEEEDEAAENLRYQSTEDSNYVLECKILMLRVVMHTLDLGMHLQISAVLHIFRTQVLDTELAQSSAAFGTSLVLPSGVVENFLKVVDEPIINIATQGLSNPSVMCVDLMMYDDPNVFMYALKLYFALICRTTALLDNLSKMEILTSQQLSVFQLIKQDVKSLGKIIYSFESWGVDDNFSDCDNSRFVELTKICTKLTNLATSGDEHSTPLEIQKMLHETEFFSHFVYCVNINPGDVPDSARPLFAKVTAAICNCTSRFIAANKKNQSLVFGVLPNMMWLLEDQPETALVITETFKGNKELCEQVKPDLIDRFAGLVLRTKGKEEIGPSYLQFFTSITVAEGKPIVQNQAAVIEAIKQRSPNAMLHLFPGEEGTQRVLHLANRFSSMEHLRNTDETRWCGGDDGRLIYYIRSLEVLYGVAFGTGSQNLVNRPWVNSLLPTATIIRLLLKSTSAVGTTSGSQAVIDIHRCLKTIWLKLLNLSLYDVDKRLMDIDLLCSPLHVELFVTLLTWIGKTIRQPSKGQSGVDDAPLLNAGEELFLLAIFSCIDSFFQNLFNRVKMYDIADTLVDAIENKYVPVFSDFLQVLDTAAVGPLLGLRDPAPLRVTAQRVMMTINPSTTVARVHSKGRRLSKTKPNAMRHKKIATSETEFQWRGMVESLREDRNICERVQDEKAQIGHIITFIVNATDPDAPEYVAHMPAVFKAGLPDGVDFRRVRLTTTKVLARFVRHSESHLGSDLRTTDLMLRVFLAILARARDSGDVSALTKLQVQFTEAGVTNLMIKVLNARLSEEITAKSWTLLSEVLCSGSRVGEVFAQGKDDTVSFVNKAVQKAIHDVCVSVDDTGIWESFGEVTDAVCQKVRANSSRKQLDVALDEETDEVRSYKAAVSYAIRVMEATRLMVEGHFFPMQQYLFAQVGNSRSCNVPEVVSKLLNRLTPNIHTADLAEPFELECISQCLTLLSELAGGPNLRNQEFLSALGVTEQAEMLLSCDFQRMQRIANDLYPPVIRRLKASLVQVVLSLVEGRVDAKIHEELLQRFDYQVIKDRILFVYQYFVFGIQAVSCGAGQVSSSSNCAISLDSQLCVYFDSTLDPTNVRDKLPAAAAMAEELLEDLGDQELEELFNEALSMLALTYGLVQHSKEFENFVVVEEVESNFVEDRSRFAGMKDFLQARNAHHRQLNYCEAFLFFRRFVKTIEVVVNGELQTLHFKQPLTAMWYVQENVRQVILDTVPFSSPDVKAKAFLQLCIEAHDESKHIRALSRFSVVPKPCLKFAQRHLPDSAHRPFQIFLANDARLMDRLLQACLLLGLVLGMYVGTTLVSCGSLEDTDDDEHNSETCWSNPLAEIISLSLGMAYFACTFLWLALTICIKFPLVLRRLPMKTESFSKRSARAVNRMLMNSEISWRLTLLCFVTGALFFKHYWLFSFLLLDTFCQNTLLATMLRAMSAPARSLGMIFLGVGIITFCYAAIGIHFFRASFGDYCDASVSICTQNILYQGTRSGIVGLSSMMKPVMPDMQAWPERIVYDMSYFMVYGVIIINTIVGLIVDSFSSLRASQDERARHLDTQSFISGISRNKIDAVAQILGIRDGFSYHEQRKQNKWDYMAFVFYLREKSVQDCTGPEQAILHLLQQGDIKWLPIGRSILLEKSDAELASNEDVMQRIEQNLEGLSKHVGTTEDWRVLVRGVKELTKGVQKRLDEMQDQVSDLVKIAQSANSAAIADGKVQETVNTGGPRCSIGQRQIMIGR